MEKRTLRGHSGQSTDRSAAGGGNALAGGRFRRVCFVKAIAVGCPRSNELLPAAERSALCPECPRSVRFSMSVETSHLWQSLRSNTLTQATGTYAHEETDKAWSLLRCRAGIALARGRFRPVSLLKTTVTFVFPQEALSPTAERSVLCPK